MSTLPRFGVTELVSGQAIPETTVNENLRYVAQGAGHFIFKDRDLTAPPGSPADGDCYLVATGGTGAWSGHDGDIAFYMSTGWLFIEATEGFTAGVQDENAVIAFIGGSWTALATGSSGASTSQTKEMIAGFIASPAVKSYKLAVKMAHGGTITETTTISGSGTCTATFKVNTTALGGTANSVSSAEESQAHASSNTFSAGDDIVLTVSSNSSCADMSFSIKYTRTLD